MTLIGVRDLRQRTSEVLKRVREEKKEYVITYQGRPVALLLPIDPDAAEAMLLQASKQAASGSWEAYARLAEALRQSWPAGLDSQTLIDEMRLD